MGALVERVAVKARGIEGAEVQLGRTAAAYALVDPARITQALLQLAQNGASHGGGDLLIGSRRRGAALELFVRDHGPGVPADQRKRIFDRFHRGVGDDGRGAGGSGLGLSIVSAIAESHGGTARVQDPAEGPGAEFVLSVPVVDAVAAREGPGQPGIAVPPRPPLPDTVRTSNRREG
ncbi:MULTISPECIES: sensor histidine kinase KdpD [Microbacterium]|uniref:sensor histidine kinase n=1 Tax=Microbacterium TaxID=33882 RepID=UPI00278B81E3|nr:MULTISPECIES: HAMP domain-containing sensor histidine kinase [Microbacterium]MDQ1082195.1 signal transduction histidine kinase [Microbacterium sp. SORGH_AS_0344]MDQ1169034.1 signal transduction histidine kinase [Microbacterium proteolyticum]